MRVLRKISGTIDKVNGFIGRLCSWALIPLMVVILIEVIMRKIGAATIWGYETICFIYGFLIITVSAYGLLTGNVVKVELLIDKFSHKTRCILSLVTYVIFFFVFVTAMIPATWANFYTAFSGGTKSWSAWAPILWPWKLAMPISMVLLWLQGTSEVLKSILWLYDNRRGLEQREEEQK